MSQGSRRKSSRCRRPSAAAAYPEKRRAASPARRPRRRERTRRPRTARLRISDSCARHRPRSGRARDSSRRTPSRASECSASCSQNAFRAPPVRPPSPICKDHPRGLTAHHATSRLNGLSIARGNRRLGFELMNAKTRSACSSPEQMRTSRWRLVNPATSRIGATREAGASAPVLPNSVRNREKTHNSCG